MLSALKGILIALLLVAPMAVLAQQDRNALCTQAVTEAGVSGTGIGLCMDACNNQSLPYVTDPPLCEDGLFCCYVPKADAMIDDASCYRHWVNEGEHAGVCVDVDEEGTLCASSALSGETFCDNPAQVCCVPAAGGAAPEGQGEQAEDDQAQPGTPVVLPDPLQGATVPTFIGNVVRVFMSIAGAIALLMFVYGGVMWILSGGDQGKVKDAQKILMNATLGLILIFGAYLFASAILSAVLTPSV